MKKDQFNKPRNHILVFRNLIKLIGVPYIIVALLAAGVTILTACPGPGVTASLLPLDPKPTCVVTAAEFAGWFESGSPTLNGVVKPANSVTFPDVPNCSFYKWSEQMFLWLTSPAPPSYGGGDRIFDSPVFYDVSPPDPTTGERTFLPHTPGLIRTFNLRAAQVGPHRLPVIFDRTGRMLEIARPRFGPNGKQLIFNERGDSVEVDQIRMGPNKTPEFLDKTGNIIKGVRAMVPRTDSSRSIIVQKFMLDKLPIFIDFFGNVIDVELGQAGDSGVLLAQNGSLVYYATMVNDVYAYFLTGTKNGGITPAPSQFPTTQANLDKVIAFAAANGKTFPDPEALAIEVKSSWVEAAGLPNLSSYITMKATIPTYDKSNPNQWVPNGQTTVQLALVGMHVVGSANGHPEMIWSTFEHVNNAPNATFAYVNTSNTTITVPQSTAGSWTFCADNSGGPFNEQRMTYISPNIVAQSPFSISAANVIRWKAWGGASDSRPNPLDATTAASNTEVIAINNSVIGMLLGGDIRANYIMTGSTWTIGGASPTGSFHNGSGNEVGTSKLCNTTMETFQQGTNTLFATGINCFTCHASNQTDVSHIFDPLKPLF
jgi:hypothetical protein